MARLVGSLAGKCLINRHVINGVNISEDYLRGEILIATNMFTFRISEIFCLVRIN